jgi:hypothetical protein
MHVRMVFFVLVTIAYTNSYAAGACVQSTVKSVYPLADGSFIVILMNDASTCTAPRPKYLYVAP